MTSIIQTVSDSESISALLCGLEDKSSQLMNFDKAVKSLRSQITNYNGNSNFKTLKDLGIALRQLGKRYLAGPSESEDSNGDSGKFDLVDQKEILEKQLLLLLTGVNTIVRCGVPESVETILESLFALMEGCCYSNNLLKLRSRTRIHALMLQTAGSTLLSWVRSERSSLNGTRNHDTRGSNFFTNSSLDIRRLQKLLVRLLNVATTETNGNENQSVEHKTLTTDSIKYSANTILVPYIECILNELQHHAPDINYLRGPVVGQIQMFLEQTALGSSTNVGKYKKLQETARKGLIRLTWIAANGESYMTADKIKSVGGSSNSTSLLEQMLSHHLEEAVFETLKFRGKFRAQELLTLAQDSQNQKVSGTTTESLSNYINGNSGADDSDHYNLTSASGSLVPRLTLILDLLSKGYSTPCSGQRAGGNVVQQMKLAIPSTMSTMIMNLDLERIIVLLQLMMVPMLTVNLSTTNSNKSDSDSLNHYQSQQSSLTSTIYKKCHSLLELILTMCGTEFIATHSDWLRSTLIPELFDVISTATSNSSTNTTSAESGDFNNSSTSETINSRSLKINSAILASKTLKMISKSVPWMFLEGVLQRKVGNLTIAGVDMWVNPGPISGSRINNMTLTNQNAAGGGGGGSVAAKRRKKSNKSSNTATAESNTTTLNSNTNPQTMSNNQKFNHHHNTPLSINYTIRSHHTQLLITLLDLFNTVYSQNSQFTTTALSAGSGSQLSEVVARHLTTLQTKLLRTMWHGRGVQNIDLVKQVLKLFGVEEIVLGTCGRFSGSLSSDPDSPLVRVLMALLDRLCEVTKLNNDIVIDNSKNNPIDFQLLRRQLFSSLRVAQGASARRPTQGWMRLMEKEFEKVVDELMEREVDSEVQSESLENQNEISDEKEEISMNVEDEEEEEKVENISIEETEAVPEKDENNINNTEMEKSKTMETNDEKQNENESQKETDSTDDQKVVEEKENMTNADVTDDSKKDSLPENENQNEVTVTDENKTAESESKKQNQIDSDNVIVQQKESPSESDSGNVKIESIQISNDITDSISPMANIATSNSLDDSAIITNQIDPNSNQPSKPGPESDLQTVIVKEENVKLSEENEDSDSEIPALCEDGPDTPRVG